jgi:starch synthase (maltosyl-transferring)
MPDPNGRKRVVITNLQPQVESGAFPAKVLLNKPVVISANIFSDGHDELAASLLFKHENERQWKEMPLSLISNDHWEATITPTQFGQYLFTVQGWIDHFTTWKNGLFKKKAAGQDLKVEWLIGAQLLEGINTKDKKHKALLADWAGRLREEGVEDDSLSELISGDDVATVICQCADKTLATKYGHTYLLDVERERAGFSTWYELFPRSASDEAGRHGTFQDVKRLLPRIAETGFDVLYFPPIHPIGRIKRKGRNNSLTPTDTDPGSPWAIGNEMGGHKAIHPELGTLKDFKDLINAARKLNIEIAMDIAFQCAPDHPWVRTYPQWFKWRPDGTVQYAENPPKRYEDILPLNFETEDWEALWQELKSVFDYWIEQGVSIFRVDNPHTKSFQFWEWVVPAIRREHPEAIFLAEAFTRPRLMERLAKVGYTQSYTYFTWRQTKQELEEYLTELTRTERRWYMRPNFWPNTPDILHEELVHGGENKHVIRLILAATMSSNYGLYGPVYEFGINEQFPGKEEYMDNEKYEIKHWDWKRLTRIGEMMARVNKMRKEHPALQDTYNIAFAQTTNEQIICYVKLDAVTGDTLIIVVNLDAWNTQSAMVHIPLAMLGIENSIGYQIKDLLSGDSYTWHGGENYVQLNPHEMPAHIFQVITQEHGLNGLAG